MTPSMIGALVGYFILIMPSVLRVPFGEWKLGAILFVDFEVRLIAAVICGVISKCIWE